MDFFCSTCAMDSASARSASNRRSVLKMLYSVSSGVKGCDVSGVPSAVPVEPASKPWPLLELKLSTAFNKSA
jgi:hypothetical protein